MKKKELILDFTSLLDVIMILLFVVISNMNQASLAINEEAEMAVSEARSQYADISSQLEELKNEYDILQNEYDYLKITTDYDADDVSVYEATIERMAKVVLICNTDENDLTGNYEVKINIYLDENINGESSFLESVIIEHDLNLSREEREKVNAEQVLNVTRVLSGALRDVDEEMIWVSVQYAYDDENFSNSDLRIIKESINNLERSFSKTCYIDEIKLY
ncbi:MAG: hypothetical protein J1E83_13590 [Lachnospiraceae bacterium]|nr:hypothetical protein [Lachnospiraceae bacterium]